jgi:hypothetical protein
MALSLASQTNWKEYVFQADRFAITLPYEVTPHADTAHEGMTVYTVKLDPRSALSIRSKLTSNCEPELKRAIEIIAHSTGLSKPKIISMAGQVAYEDQRKMKDHMSYTRLWCGDGRAFAASLSWPETAARPEKAFKIMNSFRVWSPAPIH